MLVYSQDSMYNLLKTRKKKKEEETDRYRFALLRGVNARPRIFDVSSPPSSLRPPIHPHPPRRIFKRPWRSSETRLCRLGHWIHRHGKPILPWKEANSFTWPRPPRRNPPCTRIPTRKILRVSFFFFLPFRQFMANLSFFSSSLFWAWIEGG